MELHNKKSNVRWWKPTESEILEIQKFYDEKNSLNKCTSKFGWSKSALIKYIKTRPPGKIPVGESSTKEKNVKRVVAWRQRIKQKLVEYMGGKCYCCGYNRCVRSLNFHHKDPSQKEFGITAQTKSFEKIKSEVDKCILVCSNCHGEIHAGLISIPL